MAGPTGFKMELTNTAVAVGSRAFLTAARLLDRCSWRRCLSLAGVLPVFIVNLEAVARDRPSTLKDCPTEQSSNSTIIETAHLRAIMESPHALHLWTIISHTRLCCPFLLFFILVGSLSSYLYFVVVVAAVFMCSVDL